MSKLIDITDKLNFEEKPSVRVKNVDLVINNDAVSMLKVAALLRTATVKVKMLSKCIIFFLMNPREKRLKS